MGEISREKINPYEEFFSRLQFPGVSYCFAISKEENYEGEWIYRIYSPTEDEHQRIDEYTFNKIRDLMATAADAFNASNDISAQYRVNELMKIWKHYWSDKYGSLGKDH